MNGAPLCLPLMLTWYSKLNKQTNKQCGFTPIVCIHFVHIVTGRTNKKIVNVLIFKCNIRMDTWSPFEFLYPCQEVSISWFIIFFCFFLQQAWSNRAQQILVPTWPQVAPSATTLASDTVAGPQRLAEWGWVKQASLSLYLRCYIYLSFVPMLKHDSCVSHLSLYTFFHTEMLCFPLPSFAGKFIPMATITAPWCPTSHC